VITFKRLVLMSVFVLILLLTVITSLVWLSPNLFYPEFCSNVHNNIFIILIKMGIMCITFYPAVVIFTTNDDRYRSQQIEILVEKIMRKITQD